MTDHHSATRVIERPVALDTALLGLGRRAARWLSPESALKRSLQPVYEVGLDMLSRRRGLPWRINGTPCRIVARHRARLPQRYDPEVADFLRQRVQPGDIVFDVGANLGAYTLQFAHWVGPTGRVFAFEPNQHARRVLALHLELSGLLERVTIISQALSSEAGRAELFFDDVDGKSRLGAPNPVLAESAVATPVEVTTLDLACEALGVLPRFVKIDIEGYELQALQGARTLLSSSALSGLVVEMHPPWDETGEYRNQLERLLAEQRLSVAPLVGQQDPLGEHALVWLQPQRPK
jgi:FkbM family methyltransferase